MDRMEFWKLLMQVRTSNIKNTSTIALFNYLKENTPKHLYRYMKGTDYDLKNLENNEIWGSKISTFNDPFEALPSFNEDDFITSFIKSIEKLDLGNLNLESMKNNFNLSFPNANLGSIVSLFNSFSLTNSNILKGEIIKAVNTLYKNEIEQIRKTAIDSYFRDYANNFYIACFSQDVQSLPMWYHYTKGGTGFVLEYDFSDNFELCKNSDTCGVKNTCQTFCYPNPIFPVFYSNTRFDMVNIVIRKFLLELSNKIGIEYEDQIRDPFLVLKSLLLKSKEWEYEKEWRILSRGGKVKECKDLHVKIMKKKPIIVIMGPKLSRFNDEELRNYNGNKEKLKEICKKQGIKFCETFLDYKNTRFELNLPN